MASESGGTGSRPPNTAQRYLRQAFQMNPMWEAERILELRRSALKMKKAVVEPEGPSVAEMQKRRDSMRRLVDKIQHEFWTLPLDQLQRRIGAVDIKQVPELAGVVKRLRTTAICRGEFPKLASAGDMHLALFRSFKNAVVLPPSEAGYVREQFLQSIIDRKQLGEIKKAIKLIRKDYPVLYNLEKDWFQTINGLKKPKAERQTETVYRNDYDSEPMDWLASWPMWIAISVVLRVVFRLMSGGD